MVVDNRIAMYKNLLTFVLVLTSYLALAQQNSTYREFTKEYLTYPFSDPDPIPTDTKIYPYFRFDGFTDKGVAKDWKVVELENEYIKVQIMPEIGGKVWTATDKKTGKDFFYNNNVVKFRDIAMRGPWVSGGIEANYGIIGHTPNSATPVDYLVRNNADGSASCYISTLDLLTRTRWVLETRLEKDKAYFTTRSYWFNGTGVERPYYTWMNAGIRAGDDLQFLYPGDHYIGHDGSAHPWPVDDHGRDLSRYSENNFGPSKSYHVLGAPSDYFGALWKKDDFGMIHYAQRNDKLGKKIFLWAQSDQGKIWEHLLTDDSGQYVEIQSGRLFNQNIFESSFTPFKQIGFAPYTSDRWTEYWYPFAGIVGFTGANPVGAFNVQVSGEELSVKISPVQTVRDSLRVYNTEGKKIAAAFIEADPRQTVESKLGLPNGERPGRIELNGHRLEIGKKEPQKSLARPLEIPEGFDTESTYGLYLQGRDLYAFRKYGLAEKKITASLSKDPFFSPSLVEMAKLKLFRMQYDSAFYYSKKALGLDTYNGEANYYYGLSATRLSKNEDALDGFEAAALTPQFRNAAYTALARQHLKRDNFTKASEYADMALAEDPDNMDALKLLHVLARIEQDNGLLKEVENKIEALNPLNHFIRFENYYISPTDENKKRFTEPIQNEMPVETYLELAIWYANNNRMDETRKVLEMAPQNAEVLYWLAWSNRNENSEKSKSYLKKAEDAPLDFVFPFREETAVVLDWTSKENPSWHPDYLLALIQEFRGNGSKALALLDKHQDKPVDFAPFYFVKARLDSASTLESKLELVEKAAKLEPDQWRYGRTLAHIWQQMQNDQKAVQVLEDYYRADKSNYIIGLDLIRAYMLADHYEKAEKILSKINVLPFEGATDARKYYRQTKLMIAHGLMEKGSSDKALKKVDEAEDWPRNLGVGKPYPDLIDNNLENAIRAEIYNKIGDKASYQKYKSLVKDSVLMKAPLSEKINAISFKADERMF